MGDVGNTVVNGIVLNPCPARSQFTEERQTETQQNVQDVDTNSKGTGKAGSQTVCPRECPKMAAAQSEKPPRVEGRRIKVTAATGSISAEMMGGESFPEKTSHFCGYDQIP